MIPLVNNPTGLFPRLPAHLLPPNAAQVAVDCDFSHGTLTGVKNNGSVGMSIASGTIKSAYMQGAAWFTWDRDVDAIRGPVADDAFFRFYWTDGTALRVSRGDVGSGAEPSSYLAGVPAPSSPLFNMDETNFVLPYNDRASLFGSVKGYCENPITMERSGTGVTVGVSLAYETASQLGIEFQLYGLTCETTTATQTPGTGAATVAGTGSVSFQELGGDGASMGSGVADVFTRGTEILFRCSFVPSDSNVSWLSTIHYDGGVFSHNAYGGTNLFRIGSTNWFTTLSGGQEPTDTVLTSVAEAEPQYLVEWQFQTLDDAHAIVLLRPGGATLPPELAGIDAAVALNGTTMKVTLSRNQLAVESRAYTYTYVNQYGEEGPPAEPTLVDALDGQSLNFLPAVPSSHGYCPITKIRVYRTATGSQTTEYLFVDEVGVNVGVFNDSVKTANLGEPISTIDFLPPETGLRGLCSIGNGMFAAFKNNEVHISQPYLPYAWKPANIQTIPSAVVGLGPFESGVYVTTTAYPVIITGVDPDSMQNQRIPAIQAGVSKGSICNVGPFIAYASHDGIVTVRGLDASLDYSNKFFTRSDWRQRYGDKLSVMRMNAHDGDLLVWFTDGTLPFLLRFDEEVPSMVELSSPIYAAYVHPQADALYVGMANSLYEFKAGLTRKPFTWHSKDFIEPKPLNYGVLQLIGTGTAIFEVYADGEQIHNGAVDMDELGRGMLRLPDGFLSRRWSVKLIGLPDAEIKEAYLARVPSELQGV